MDLETLIYLIGFMVYFFYSLYTSINKSAEDEVTGEALPKEVKTLDDMLHEYINEMNDAEGKAAPKEEEPYETPQPRPAPLAEPQPKRSSAREREFMPTYTPIEGLEQHKRTTLEDTQTYEDAELADFANQEYEEALKKDLEAAGVASTGGVSNIKAKMALLQQKEAERKAKRQSSTKKAKGLIFQKGKKFEFNVYDAIVYDMILNKKY